MLPGDPYNGGGRNTEHEIIYIIYIYIDSDGAAKLGDKASVKPIKMRNDRQTKDGEFMTNLGYSKNDDASSG